MEGVWFDRKKVGRTYRYRVRFPTPEEVTAMPSVAESRNLKGHQSVSQSSNGNRDTKSVEGDTSSHPIMGHQPVSPRPIPIRIDKAPERADHGGHARQAFADQGESADPEGELHPCTNCGTMIVGDVSVCFSCRLDEAGVHRDASQREPFDEPPKHLAEKMQLQNAGESLLPLAINSAREGQP